jgi:hypothetical protein
MQQTASRSGESDMTASDAESWAKLRLVEGESSAKKWELVSSLGHTTLTVGSNSDCTWVVRADGVRPIHFSLHWDGSTLRAADVYSAGDVRVDGTTLGSQWRALAGDVRIEFGKAVMQVETSPPLSGRSAAHPLEQPAGTSGSDRVADSRRRSSSPSRSGKETLIGVAPSSLAGLQASLSAGAPSTTTPGNSAATQASTEAEARAARAKAERSMKATLVGGIGIINAQLPLKSDPSPLVTPSPTAGATPPSKAKANATLMGFASLDMLKGGVGTQPAVNVGGQGAAGQPLGGGSLGDADQRTSQGFPNSASSSAPPSSSTPAPAGRRMTKQGMVSQPPGVRDDAVAQAPVRAVSERPGAREPNERIGSAWQERADPDAFVGSRGDEARASSKAARTLRGIQDDDEESPDQRAPRLGGHGHWDQGVDRMSDIPTQMRDAASFESRRPRRGFPWRYVGVLVLTSVAYFAWLYLLDHM